MTADVIEANLADCWGSVHVTAQVRDLSATTML